MHIDWWTLALQTINLLVLLWLLGRFLFRPIARIVEERQAAVAKALDDARAMREQAEMAEGKAKDAAAKVAAEREGVLKKAGEEAAQERARMVEDAQADADKLIEEAKREIEQTRDAEEKKIAKRASALAVDIAGRLLERLPGEAQITGFIDGLGDAIAALPDRTRAEIGANGAAIAVKAARKLSEAETQACRKAITAALGRDASISVEVDPGLVAGLEIDTPHAVIRNSLRADLDRIVKELTREEAADG